MARFRTPSIPLSADAQNVSEFYSRIYFGFRLWLQELEIGERFALEGGFRSLEGGFRSDVCYVF